jgi:hypothetical protein
MDSDRRAGAWQGVGGELSLLKNARHLLISLARLLSVLIASG